VSDNFGLGVRIHRNTQWDQIFKDPMTTMAAVDRLVHHAIIVEFDGETQRVPRQKDKGGS